MTPSPGSKMDRESLERIAALETTIKFFEQRFGELREELDELKKRLEELERKKERIAGAMALLGLVWPFISHWIYNHLLNK